MRIDLSRQLPCRVFCGFLFAVLSAGFPQAEETIHNTGMYEKYKSDKQKFLDDFAGASLKLDQQDLVPILFSSIHNLSKFPLPDKLPVIRFLPAAELSKLACHSECLVLGHYQGGDTIYLDEKLRPESNLFDRSVLLHEMVHYLQYAADASAVKPQTQQEKCVLWYTREREAYAIQDAFLVEVSSPVRAGYFPARADC
jgi:hypothetical protein